MQRDLDPNVGWGENIRSLRDRAPVGVVACFLLLPVVFQQQEAAARALSARTPIQEVREVRTVWTAELGVPHPAGVTYLPSSGELLLAADGTGPTTVLRLGFDEDRQGTFVLPELSDPDTLAADPATDRLTGIDQDAIVTADGGDLDSRRPPTSEADIASLGLRDPQGAAFDPITGTWFVLDAATQAIVRVRMPGGDPGSAGRIPLGALHAPKLQGLALNPADGLLYVGSPEQDLVFAVDRAGTARKAFSTASLDLADPQAMTFAPSSDSTDDPDTMNLFIADAGGPTAMNRMLADATTGSISGGITEVTLTAEAIMAAADVTASLVQVIDTSQLQPPSPDPSGIAYLPGPDRLMIVDSEVDEVTGAGYHGVNMWEMTRSGTVTDTGTTLAYSNEPTGAGFDPATNTLFISSDSGNRIWVVRTGPDDRFGTPDDLLASIDAGNFGVTDAEDPEFDVATGHLFFLDGVNTEVYEVDPVDGTFGDANDVVTHFDVGVYGATDVEGLTSDQAAGTLLVGNRPSRIIYEITKTGDQLVRTIDASGVVGMINISGLQIAPASDGSGQRHIWVVDRAIDNGPNPSENDGKIFELTLGATTNNPPVITSLTIDRTTPRTNDTLTVTASAGDPDGDPLTTTYQWRKNGVALSGETSATLDLSVPGNGDKGDAISVRVTASDGVAQDSQTSAQVTILNSFPVFDHDLGDLGGQEGQVVNLPAGATDDDGDNLTYEASGLPPGVAIDPDTGLISGTIAKGTASGSPYPVSVTVRDWADPPPPPTISLVQQKAGDQSATPGNTISLTFDTPPTAGNLLVAFGHNSANRTPTIPAGWSLALETGSGAETVVFYKVAEPGEPSTVTYSVSGADVFMGLAIFEYSGLHDVQSEVLDRTVFGSASNATSVSTGTTQPTREAQELLLASVSLNATRTFLNTWTNGFTRQTVTRRQTIAQQIVSGAWQFETTESWSTSAGTAIGALVTFRTTPDPIPDPNPGSATDTFSWIVTPAGPNTPPVIDSVEVAPTAPKTGDSVSAVVTAHDDEGHPLTYQYQWAMNGADLPGETSATLDLSVAGNGDRDDLISVTVTATDGLASSTPVSSAPITVANSDPAFDQDLGDRASLVGEVVSLPAPASDPDGDALTYDATGLPPGLDIDPSSGLISGTIDAAASSTPYAVAVTVGDGPDVDATDTFAWTVNLPPAAPTGLAPSLTSVSVELDWADNIEADLAGYNVYRGSSPDGPFTKLNGPLLTISRYSDTTAPPSATSYYRVTAVDVASQGSSPATTSATRVISFRSASTATVRDTSGITVPRPGGVASGDLLLAAVTVSRTPTVTAPSGWTLIRVTTNGATLRQALYYRVAGSSEPTSYRWTFSSNNSAAATISAYRGVDPISPIMASEGQANGSSTSITAPAVTTTVGNALVAGFFGIATNGSITPPSGMIEHAEAIQSSGSRKLGAEVSDLLQAQAAAAHGRRSPTGRA